LINPSVLRAKGTLALHLWSIGQAHEAERNCRNHGADQWSDRVEEPYWESTRNDHRSERPCRVTSSTTDRTTQEHASCEGEADCDGGSTGWNAGVRGGRDHGEHEDEGNQRLNQQHLQGVGAIGWRRSAEMRVGVGAIPYAAHTSSAAMIAPTICDAQYGAT